MKVNVLSIKEKTYRSERMHKVEIELGKFISDQASNKLVMSSINAGYKHYKLSLDLYQHYKDKPDVLQNGIYDRQKALSLCEAEYPVDSAIEWGGVFYDFSIEELTSGKYHAIESTQKRFSYITSFYRASLLHNREKAKQECIQHLSYLIDKGYYIPSKK